MITVNVKRTKHRDLKSTYAKIVRANDKEIAVGFPKGMCQAYPESGESVAYVAAVNVYGLGNVPERDFMRQALPLMEERCKEGMEVVGKLLMKGKDATAAMTAVGKAAETCIHSAIVDGVYEPNAPATIEKKRMGGTETAEIKPLIDTGHLKNSITSVVREK